MRFGNFLVGALTLFMAQELYQLMLGDSPMLQGWLGFAAWAAYIGMMYTLGVIHRSSVPR